MNEWDFKDDRLDYFQHRFLSNPSVPTEFAYKCFFLFMIFILIIFGVEKTMDSLWLMSLMSKKFKQRENLSDVVDD